VRHVEPQEFQIPPQHIAKNERTKITDMRKIPNCRPADIEAHFAGFERLKLLDGTR
jgi:hypothetical protein